MAALRSGRVSSAVLRKSSKGAAAQRNRMDQSSNCRRECDRSRAQELDLRGVDSLRRSIRFLCASRPLDDFANTALDTRPDLKAAMQSVEKAKTDSRLAWANGSTDPVIALGTRGIPRSTTHSIFNTLGASISIPSVSSTATRAKSCAPARHRSQR